MPKQQVDRLRKMWQEGQATRNCWLVIPSTLTAEAAALAGFDSVTIDMQHGLIDFSNLTPMIQAIQAHDVPVLVRPPWNEPSILMRLLDVGADGLIVPMIDDAPAAAALVAACRYPPKGRRSSGPLRAGMVAGPDYFATADDSMLILPMIESVLALENLDAILDTERIDGVYIGPADLSLALGFPPETDSRREEHQIAVKTIVEKCRARQLVAGLHTATPAFAAAAAG